MTSSQRKSLRIRGGILPGSEMIGEKSGGLPNRGGKIQKDENDAAKNGMQGNLQQSCEVTKGRLSGDGRTGRNKEQLRKTKISRKESRKTGKPNTSSEGTEREKGGYWRVGNSQENIRVNSKKKKGTQRETKMRCKEQSVEEERVREIKVTHQKKEALDAFF